MPECALVESVKPAQLLPARLPPPFVAVHVKAPSVDANVSSAESASCVWSDVDETRSARDDASSNPSGRYQGPFIDSDVKYVNASAPDVEMNAWKFPVRPAACASTLHERSANW